MRVKLHTHVDLAALSKAKGIDAVGHHPKMRRKLMGHFGKVRASRAGVAHGPLCNQMA